MAEFQKPIPLELPERLQRSLLAYQQQQSLESPASAILSILEQFFQQNGLSANYATQEQLQQLEAKVNDLSEWVGQLRRTISPLPATEKVSSPQATVNGMQSRTFASSFDLLEDDIDDEPDEVLYDFLE